MILTNHSDVSYLSEPKARSQSGGYFYRGNQTTNHTFLHNGAILFLCKILQNLIASATEAKIGALFENTKDDVHIRHTLEEMGHQKLANPLKQKTTSSEAPKMKPSRRNAPNPLT